MTNHDTSVNFKDHESIRMVGRPLGGRIPLFLFIWNLEKLFFQKVLKEVPKREKLWIFTFPCQRALWEGPQFFGGPSKSCKSCKSWGKVAEKWGHECSRVVHFQKAPKRSPRGALERPLGIPWWALGGPWGSLGASLGVFWDPLGGWGLGLGRRKNRSIDR